MRDKLPPLWKLSARILVLVHQAADRFPRKHRYSIGTEIRDDARQVRRLVVKAWRDRGARLQRLEDLVAAVDDLKDSMQLGQELKAFGSFAEFEAVMREIHEAGRQAGKLDPAADGP